MRGLVFGLVLVFVLAGAAEARGHRMGGAPRSHGGGRHRSGMGEIKEIKPLGPSEFRPYKAPKRVKPFSYLDHERRGGKAD